MPTGSLVETFATKPGVGVGLGVPVGVAVGVGVGVGGAPEISTLAENSEVLPAGSVAVAADNPRRAVCETCRVRSPQRLSLRPGEQSIEPVVPSRIEKDQPRCYQTVRLGKLC